MIKQFGINKSINSKPTNLDFSKKSCLLQLFIYFMQEEPKQIILYLHKYTKEKK